MLGNSDSVVVAMDGGEFAKVMDAETISQMAQGECAYEGSFNEMVADALVAAFDEEETSEDFWAKHDKQHHHGHYDPATQRCSLREKAKAGEERREGEDRETDDLVGESPDEGRERPLVSEEEDAAYLDAVRRGDMETAQRMVREVAGRVFPDTKVVDEGGIPLVVHHGTNNEFSVFDKDKLGSKNALAESAYKGFFFARSLATAKNYTGLTQGDLALDDTAQALLKSIKDKYEYGKAEAEFEAAHRAAKAEYGRRNGMPDEQTLRDFLKGTVLNEKAIQRGIDDMQRLWWYTEAANGKSNLDNFEEAFKGTAEHRRFDELGKKIWDEFSKADLERRGYKPHVMDLYLGIKNPLVYDFEGKERDLTFADLIDKAKAEGHDGCIFKNVADGADIDEIYVAFDSNQIKSADPVTYDDEGEVVPLSKRFDSGNDIRGDVNWREKESRAASAKPEPLKPREMGISRIFTGSSADYEKPSLLKVGTGEGSQVYGWGLYGSTVRGVAEGYADNYRADEIEYLGERPPTKIAEFVETNLKSHHGDIDATVQELSSNPFPRFKESAQWLKDNRDGIRYTRKDTPHLYEQTFFTDREPGDESHLLRWYDKLTREQAKWIKEQSLKEGIFEKIIAEIKTPPTGEQLYFACAVALGENGRLNPKAASEFLARAGIDGIKYPVDSYGGKTIKDGDKAGWNYVSFRDDNIRIDRKYVDGQKVFDYQELMGKRFPGVNALAVLNRISKMGSREAMAAEFRRILTSGKITEDSLNEVMALAVEAAFGIGQDALDPSDPDFWMKHDRARHHGHFDPTTMTCKLREAYAKGEAIENLRDEMDDLGGGAEVAETPYIEGVSRKVTEKYFRLMAKHHPDIDAKGQIEEAGKIEDPKVRKDAVTWLLKGVVTLPEDLYKVRQARELATKAKKDPFGYETPQACINALMGQGHRISEKPITVEELKKNPLMSDYRDEGYGVETFQVDDSREGQALMRKVIDTHWGEDANPWCLLARQGGAKLERTAELEEWIDKNYDKLYDELGLGNIPIRDHNKILEGKYEEQTGKKAREEVDHSLDDAWGYWNKYNALPKRVAFKNGKLLAFMATEKIDLDKWHDAQRFEEQLDAKYPHFRRQYDEWTATEEAQENGIPEFADWLDTNGYIDKYEEAARPAEEWWDRQDKAHAGIPVSGVAVPYDRMGRKYKEAEIVGGALQAGGSNTYVGKVGSEGYREWFGESDKVHREITDGWDMYYDEDGDREFVSRGGEEVHFYDGGEQPHYYINDDCEVEFHKGSEDPRTMTFSENEEGDKIEIAFHTGMEPMYINLKRKSGFDQMVPQAEMGQYMERMSGKIEAAMRDSRKFLRQYRAWRDGGDTQSAGVKGADLTSGRAL